MEFPHLGKQCCESSCKKLDFLPVKCDACEQIFCNEHYFYSNHNCPSSYKKDVQVPACPLCNALVPVPRNQLPDIAVGAHIDNDCQSDPAKNRRKAYINRCTKKGCKVKEIVPILCSECSFNFCLKHRHPTDHACEGKTAASRRKVAEAAVSRQTNKTNKAIRNSPPASSRSVAQNPFTSVQGSMSEDEALARALALSMQDQEGISQEDADLAIARSLQQAENRQVAGTAGGGSRNTKDRCSLS